MRDGPNDTETTPPKKPGPNWHRLALIVVAVVAVSGPRHHLARTHNPADPAGSFHRLGGRLPAPGAGWCSSFLLILHSFVPFPLEFAAVAAGITYGFWIGTIVTWIGTVLGGIAVVLDFARFGRAFFERALKPNQLAWIDKHAKDEGWVALLVSRLLPFVSFTLISYAAGLTPVSLVHLPLDLGVRHAADHHDVGALRRQYRAYAG